ncbi:MAG: glutathione peroxidase [Planctomycetia bacterium]
MKSIFTLAAGCLLSIGVSADGADAPKSPLDFTVKSIDGKPVELSKYKGKVVLVVNVASQCGLTPQYEKLQGLHDKFSDKGLAVLGFPSNDFGSQEPGSDSEIQQFCTANYGVKFDMFSKVAVKGSGAAPLYDYLTAQKIDGKTGPISWNFEKFLIGRDGKVVARFAPRVDPDSAEVMKAVETELAKK